MEPDAAKLFDATMRMLQQHLEKTPYPVPTDNADLAAVVSCAFLRGAAFVAQSFAVPPDAWIAMSNRMLAERAKRRRSGIITPADFH